jgi:hypothetical protein
VRNGLAAGGLFALVVALGAIFIPYAGIQYDEALFTEAIYSVFRVEHAMKFGEFRLPIMLLTYMGTIKAGIYALLLSWFDASVWTLRLPPLVWAAASVSLFFLTMRRLCGFRPALLASVLLATDAMYLLTSVFDWGPVALQHLLTAIALYAGVRYAQERRPWLAGVAAASCGLALWDKAVFVWVLVGGAVALMAVFPRELAGMARNRRTLLTVAGCFLLGALPFLYYNKIHPLRTITANVEEDAEPRLNKVRMLDKTLDGGGLFGYMVRHSPEGFPQGLRWVEKIPLFASGKLRAPQMSLQHLLLAAALFGAPLLWFTPWRRAAMFALVLFLVSWLLMIYSRATGGGAHHTILLWPLPQWLLALGIAAVQDRMGEKAFRAAALATLLCTASNLVLLNQYMAQFISSGPTWIWSDAVFPLKDAVEKRLDRYYCSVDWGVANQLRFLTKGRVRFLGREDGITLDFDTPRRDEVLSRLLWDPKSTFILRTEGREVFGGSRDRFLARAKELGYQGAVRETFHDRHGSPVFELWEFHR